MENGIENFIKDKSIDLVAICTYGKSGIKQLISPSIAERMANHIPLPLLSIRL